MAPAMKPQGRRFGYLDSIRLIAAVFVVFQHLTEHRGDWVARNLSPLGIGLGGVALFFFISGYVVPLSVGKALDLRSFAIKRWFRLYPLYLVALAFLIAISLAGVLPNWRFMLSAPAFDWVANLLLIQEFVGARPFLGVSWTLIIEIIWYTMFSLSVVWFGKRAGDVLDIVMPVTVLAMCAVSLLIEQRVPLGRPMMVYATTIGYQFYRHSIGETTLPRLARSLGVFTAVIIVSYWIAFGVYSHPNMDFRQALAPWLIATALFTAILLTPALRNSEVLNAGWLPRLGAYSYSIYLLHPVAIAAATQWFEGPWRGPVAIALTALLAWIGFRFVETPAIAMGRKVADRAGAGGPARARG